jgi:prephenate dehydratase
MLSIAHLGPAGTYAEMAALTYARHQAPAPEFQLRAFRSIPITLQAVAAGEADVAVVPVENSVEGSVSATLDTLWQLEPLQIQQALILPIAHALISTAEQLDQIRVVQSHPQALAQCQTWLQTYLPQAQLIAMNSTSEALQHIQDQPGMAAIASRRAAELYQLPILAFPINDSPENCTRFWVVSPHPSPGGAMTSLALSLRRNEPGALVQPLQVLSERHLNMSRIESRPTKRSLGEYLFFIDLEANAQSPEVQAALKRIEALTEHLRFLGSYDVVDLSRSAT